MLTDIVVNWEKIRLLTKCHFLIFFRNLPELSLYPGPHLRWCGFSPLGWTESVSEETGNSNPFMEKNWPMLATSLIHKENWPVRDWKLWNSRGEGLQGMKRIE
jgi:hypothetical protein